ISHPYMRPLPPGDPPRGKAPLPEA
ncbi:hypothetical protein A2U01_0073851, partial [Trifolium medium]|nr:hypothetical protein [Trifolium medium]